MAFDHDGVSCHQDESERFGLSFKGCVDSRCRTAPSAKMASAGGTLKSRMLSKHFRENDLTGVLLRKFGPEGLRVVRALLAYRTNPVSAASRYWNLYRNRSFAPDEIHFFQLLDPSLTPADLARVVSKEELLQLQLRLNEPTLRGLTEDKARFHEHCLTHGLPVPRIFALYDARRESRSPLRTLHDRHEIEDFLASLDADALIFKPVSGANGEGVTRLQRSGTTWLDHSGKPVDGQGVVQSVGSSGYSRWMFQELVHGHPELCALSATTGLQTVRVVTALERGGKVRILAMRLRLICSNIAFDNFNYGTTGNVIANVNVETGEVFSVVSNAQGVPSKIERHPRTNVPLIGYRVPQWDAVKSLAEQAALAFTPLKTVGWDVAIALPEPCLIEGNVTWGILSGEPRMGEIYRFLKTLQE